MKKFETVEEANAWLAQNHSPVGYWRGQPLYDGHDTWVQLVREYLNIPDGTPVTITEDPHTVPPTLDVSWRGDHITNTRKLRMGI